MPYTPRYKKEIYQELVSIVVAQSALTDISPGSALTHLLGSVAQEMELIEFRLRDLRNSFNIDRASGIELDYRVADLPPSGIARKGANRAGGSVIQVTFVGALDEDLLIPAGSMYSVPSQGDITFTQTTDVTAKAGTSVYPSNTETEPYIRVVASVSGPQGNVQANTITNIISAPEEILSVTNPLGLSGGQSAESDSSLRQRAKAYLGSLSRITAQALQFVVSTYISPIGESVRHARVIEEPSNPGFTEVVVDPGGAGLAEFLLNVPQADTVLDPGEEFAWEGKAPAMLYHSFPAVQPITMSDIQIYVYDKNNQWGKGFGRVLFPFDHPAVRDWYGLPPGISPFISVYERGHLYLDPYFPMDASPRYGYEADDPNYSARVELILKPFTRYVGIVAQLQSYIEGDPTDPVVSPGYRPAGCRVAVRLPFVQNVGQMKINLTLESGLFVADVEDLVRLEISALVAELAPGERLKLAAITERLMGLPEINNVVILEPSADIDPHGIRYSLRIDPLEIILS